MNPITVLDNQIEITFKKRSMRTYLTESYILDELELNSMDSNQEKILASNFAAFMANTEAIKPIAENINELASDWLKFWGYSRTHTGYAHLFMAYTEQLPVEINNVWHDAYNMYQLGDITVNDPDLQPPDMVPVDTLNDPDVQKKEMITELE